MPYWMTYCRLSQNDASLLVDYIQKYLQIDHSSVKNPRQTDFPSQFIDHKDKRETSVALLIMTIILMLLGK